MGVTGLTKFVRQQFPQAVKSCRQQKYEVIQVDANALFHDSLRPSKTLKQFSIRLGQFLNSSLQTPATCYVGLMADGVPPVSKLHTQRVRRKQTAKTDIVKLVNKSLSTVLLTPGTDLMRLAEETMFKVAIKRVSSSSASYVISSDFSAGEGEWKLFKWLRSLSLSKNSPVSVLTISPDSDIILYALLDSSGFSHDIDGGGGQVLNCDELRKNILLRTWSSNCTPTEQGNVVADFVLCMLLRNSDFLPGISTATRMWSTYCRLREKDPSVFLVYPLQRMLNVRLLCKMTTNGPELQGRTNVPHVDITSILQSLCADIFSSRMLIKKTGTETTQFTLVQCTGVFYVSHATTRGAVLAALATDEVRQRLRQELHPHTRRALLHVLPLGLSADERRQLEPLLTDLQLLPTLDEQEESSMEPRRSIGVENLYDHLCAEQAAVDALQGTGPPLKTHNILLDYFTCLLDTLSYFRGGGAPNHYRYTVAPSQRLLRIASVATPSELARLGLSVDSSGRACLPSVQLPAQLTLEEVGAALLPHSPHAPVARRCLSVPHLSFMDGLSTLREHIAAHSRGGGDGVEPHSPLSSPSPPGSQDRPAIEVVNRRVRGNEEECLSTNPAYPYLQRILNKPMSSVRLCVHSPSAKVTPCPSPPRPPPLSPATLRELDQVLGIKLVKNPELVKNPVQQLHEYIDKNKASLEFTFAKREDGNMSLECVVQKAGLTIKTAGIGRSKKEAKLQAAIEMLANADFRFLNS
jgi:hypothetical protein